MNQQQQPQPLDPKTFFNRLKLVNLPDDMKQFIVNAWNGYNQVNQINGTLILGLKEMLLTRQEELGNADYTAFLDDETMKKMNGYDLDIDLGAEDSKQIKFGLASVATRDLNAGN